MNWFTGVVVAVAAIVATGSMSAQAPSAGNTRQCTNNAHDEIMNRSCSLPSLKNGPAKPKVQDNAQGFFEEYDPLLCREELIYGYQYDCLELPNNNVIRQVPTKSETKDVKSTEIIGAFRAPDTVTAAPASPASTK